MLGARLGAWLWETLAGTHKWAAAGEYGERDWRSVVGSAARGAWLWETLAGTHKWAAAGEYGKRCWGQALGDPSGHPSGQRGENIAKKSGKRG